MSTSPHSRDHAAAEQAALWAARLDGSELGEADQAELQAWLDLDPSHRTLLSEYCQFSTDLERVVPALAAAGAFELPPPPRPRAWRWLPWTAGLTTACAAIAVAILWLAGPGASREGYSTSIGERRTITLDDGTQVELSAATSLLVQNDRWSRHVRMASGEAFFHVSKDPSRPFTVETPTGSVRVTGTVFDVATDAKSAFDVVVAEGSVLVHPRPLGAAGQAAPVSLHAGDALSARPEGVTLRHLSASELDNVLAWREGSLVFDGTPLREALARFARYHGRGIVATQAAGDLHLGGRFSLDDLDGFLSGIEEALPVKVSRDSSGTVHVSLRTEP